MTKMASDIPFGWKRKKRIMIEQDSEQWIIRRILDQVRLGVSLEEISLELKRLGIRPRAGGEWFPRRIRRVLLENESLQAKVNGVAVEEPLKLDTHLPDIQCSPTMPTKALRPGTILYEVQDLRLVPDGSLSEGKQRTSEVSKIVTHALLLAVEGKRETEQLLKGGGDEIQDRDLRSGEHGGAGPA